MFKHFLITRYNLRIPGWTATRNNEPIDDNWMNHRFEIFSKYCLPSVVNQTNHDFTWLIFLNADTTEKHRQLITELILGQSNIRLVYVEEYKELLVKLKKTISSELHNEQYIITTRLDNDDCIRKDFVQLIQNEFAQQDKCIIDFPKGLSLEIEPKIRLAYRRIRLNPFISLIENIHSFQTVMHYFKHRAWEKINIRTKSIKNYRPWLQLVHDKNKLNSFKGLFLCNKVNHIADFGISIPGNFQYPGLFLKVQHFIYTFLFLTKTRLKYEIYNLLERSR